MTGNRTLDDNDIYLIKSLDKERIHIQKQLRALEREKLELKRQLKEVSSAGIARKFGVSSQHIYRIIHNQQRAVPSDTTVQVKIHYPPT